MAKTSVDSTSLFAVDENTRKLWQWLDEKWPRNRRICPICDHKDWLVAPDVAFLASLKQKGLFLGQGYPYVLVSCTNCGYTHLFNAMTMGIPLASQPEEPTDG